VSEPLVITGIGAVTPLGVGASTLHGRWAAGECGIVDGLGRCLEFEPGEWLSRKEIRRTPRFAQMALAATAEAVAQAGWADGLPCGPDRVGCVIGTGIGAQTTIESQTLTYVERGPVAIPPLQVATALGNSAAVSVQLRYGLKGESYGVVGACAAGAQAIGAAMRMIRGGEVDAMVVGGAESAISEIVSASLQILGASSKLGLSRPFDRQRDGFVLGEGAGIMVLESAALARERGAPELGRITGYGASSDAFHVTAPPPDAAGSIQALWAAFRQAGIAPEDVQYVNAHGTSTVLNDRAETLALKTVFGSHADKVQVSSTKSAIGHLIGAAGAVEAIAALYVLQTEVVPPTVGLEDPEEGLDLNFVPGAAQPLHPPRPGRPPIAISNSFGFGGHNTVLVMEPGETPLPADDGGAVGVGAVDRERDL
jgi:3-oxoacyl-[acyl-carrier-protein] synthase II